MRSARGASAFTQTDRSCFSLAGEAGPVFSRADDAPAHTWAKLIDELLRIRNLEDDWDGEGTEAPHPALVDGAITLAQDLEASGAAPADRVIAGVNGTIYFEWHTPLGYQEIEVTSPLDAECRWVQKGTDEAVAVGLSRRR
jgi:hypothetical protein